MSDKSSGNKFINKIKKDIEITLEFVTCLSDLSNMSFLVSGLNFIARYPLDKEDYNPHDLFSSETNFLQTMPIFFEIMGGCIKTLFKKYEGIEVTI